MGRRGLPCLAGPEPDPQASLEVRDRRLGRGPSQRRGLAVARRAQQPAEPQGRRLLHLVSAAVRTGGRSGRALDVHAGDDPWGLRHDLVRGADRRHAPDRRLAAAGWRRPLARPHHRRRLSGLRRALGAVPALNRLQPRHAARPRRRTVGRQRTGGERLVLHGRHRNQFAGRLGVGQCQQQKAVGGLVVVEHLAVELRERLAQRNLRDALARPRAGDPRRAELDRHPSAGGLGVEQLVRPKGVAVARDHDAVGARLLHQPVEPLPVGGIAVPHVRAPGQAQGRIGLDPRQPVGRRPVHLALGRRVGLGGHVFVDRRREQPGHHHLVADHLPRPAGLHRGGQAVAQPGLLRGGHHPARRVVQALFPGGDLGRRGLGRHFLFRIELMVARGQAGLKHEQAGDVAEVEAAVDREAAAGRLADRHPLVIGLDRRGLALVPVALAGRLVIFSPAHPAVVGGLVIVPDHDPGRARAPPAAAGRTCTGRDGGGSRRG